MKLWINDSLEKPPPDGTWIWAKSLGEAIHLFFSLYGSIREISFDHDLGERDGRKEDVMPLCYIIEQLASARILKRIKWSVNSENPVGQQRIYSAMAWADKQWNAAEDTSSECN